MKKGFYYINGLFERCYYLTGEKKGNKWIDIAYDGQRPMNEPEWWALNWMCMPTEETLKEATYHEENPTKYKLN